MNESTRTQLTRHRGACRASHRGDKRRGGALSAARPPRGPRSLAILGLGAAALALSVTACGHGADQAPPKPPVPVTVGLAALEPAPLQVNAPGTVDSKNTVDVRARVGGEILQVHFHEGDEVQQGQLLFSIDPRPFQAALGEAQGRLQRDRVLADNADKQAARYAELVTKDYVTKEQHDRAQADAGSQKANLAADEAAVQDAKLQLEYASIRAPISGRVGAVLAKVGNNIKANDQSLVVLHQMAPIDVRFAVPQQYLPQVRARAAADALPVTVTDTAGAVRTGKLTFIDNAIDTQTGTIQLKATMENADRALWPGQLVQASLQLGNEPAVVAPESAVSSGQQGDYVYVVKDDQTVESRPVKVARSWSGKVVIAEGLKGGETIVTDGQLRLVPGAKVTYKTAGQESAGMPAKSTGGQTQGANP
jgi:multidrug efflux system membrane fusion protein